MVIDFSCAPEFCQRHRTARLIARGRVFRARICFSLLSSAECRDQTFLECGSLAAAFLPYSHLSGKVRCAFQRIKARDCATAGIIIYNRAGIASREHMTQAPSKPRIVIGSDHAGFSVKEIIRKHLESSGYAVYDLGTSSEESVDYPDYGKAVGERVVSKQADLGLAVSGSGIGIYSAAH